MKKTLIFAVCAALASMASLVGVSAGPGDDKPGPGADKPTPAAPVKPGGGESSTISGFTVNHGNGAGGTGTFTAQADKSALTVGLSKNETGKGFTFGTYTYTYDSEGNILHSGETIIGTVGEDGSTITSASGETVSSVVSGAFAEGAVAGLWVEVDGVKYYSDGSYKGHQHVDVKGNKEEPDPFVCFDVPGGDGRNVSKIHLSIGGGNVRPASGQPLPGILATVALAGAIGGYLKRRKANRQA